MYELFEDNNAYIFPNGKTKTGGEIKLSGDFPILNSGLECVVNKNGGIVGSFSTLDEIKEQYGIFNETDKDIAINEINRLYLDAKHRQLMESTLSKTMVKAASFVALTFTDEQALEVPDLYPAYEVDHAYKKDERFTYNGRLFKVNQDHTSAEQWVPGETGTESLYTGIKTCCSIVSGDFIPMECGRQGGLYGACTGI